MSASEHERCSAPAVSEVCVKAVAIPPAAEILANIVAIEEILRSRKAAAPDLPYLELAKCVRVNSIAAPQARTDDAYEA